MTLRKNITVAGVLVCLGIGTAFGAGSNDRRIIIKDPDSGRRYEVHTRKKSPKIDVTILPSKQVEDESTKTIEDMSVVLLRSEGNPTEVALKAVEPTRGRPGVITYQGSADAVQGSWIGAELQLRFSGGKKKTLRSTEPSAKPGK